jgi:hypothetical protein
MGSRGDSRHPIPSSPTLPLESLTIYREGYSFPREPGGRGIAIPFQKVRAREQASDTQYELL